jgi:glycerol-3-phosphate O-acyltransferase / dihydroxyacetone phosphate acyltransferase
MVYAILKFISRLALKVYFKKIHIVGKELIPNEGPFLIVANHPSSFLDPVSIAILVNQKISFLAGGFMFKNKIIASILRGLNMIAIYRAQDNPEMMSGNEDVFKDCYKKLGKKGAIMIFPEGTSEMERRLRKIKTGAARIALGTEKENNYSLGVKIVPIGLNYTKSSRFKSELTIVIGKPIEVLDYAAEHQKDEIAASKKLTQEIETKIREQIIIIDKQEYDELIERVESLYKTKLIKTTRLDENKDIAKIKISQGIVKAVKHFQQTDMVLFDNMRMKIDRYFQKLETANLSDRNIEQNTQPKNLFIYLIKSIGILILGFPIWLFGIINSYIPYKLPRFIALKVTDSEAFYGALLMSFGVLSFILFYGLEIFFLGYFSQSVIATSTFAAALILTGFFTIYYARFARKFYYNWQLISSFYNKQQIVAELIEERKNIILDFEKIHKKFLET